MLEVTILQERLSIFLGMPMHSILFTFDVYCVFRLNQPNEEKRTVSVYHLSHELVAMATDISQNAELVVATLHWRSGRNLDKLCPRIFSTTSVETCLWFTLLFSEYSIPSLRTCLVDSVMLPEAPQASFLSVNLYHLRTRTSGLQVRIDIDDWPVTMSNLQRQTWILWATCF